MIALLVMPWSAFAQERVAIGSGDECVTSEWQLRETVRLGSEPEVGLSGPAQAVYRGPRGEFALFANGRVHLFGSGGELQHSFGRAGEGPGEFGNVSVIRWVGDDGIETFDNALLRRTVFSGPPGFHVEETRRIPFAFGFTSTLFHPDGRIVVNRNVRTPGRAGLPLHILDAEGAVLGSFGKDPPELRADVAFPLRRSVSWAGPNHDEVWSAHPREYRIERWTLSGDLQATVVRDVPWFEPWDMDPPLSPESPPPPRISAVEELGPRELGVILMLPAEDPARGLAREGEYWMPVRIDLVVRSRIEILDVERGCLRAAFDVAGEPLRFLRDAAVAVYREDDATGLPEIVILTLVRGEGARDSH